MASTLGLLHAGSLSISPTTAWYLTDLGEFRGRQEVFTWQSPPRFKALRKHALIEAFNGKPCLSWVLLSKQFATDCLEAMKKPGHEQRELEQA